MEQRRNRSRKRDAILACIQSTDTHPTAEWVYRQLKDDFPDLSLGTVYRNLAMFKREGTIGSVGIEDGMERFDRTPIPHAHFVCSSCHRVLDLMELAVPETFCRSAAQALDAKVDGCEVIFRGLCRTCRDTH